MRLAASWFAVVKRFGDDGEGGVAVVSAVELDADADVEAGVPRLGALLDKMPVDVLSKS